MDPSSEWHMQADGRTGKVSFVDRNGKSSPDDTYDKGKFAVGISNGKTINILYSQRLRGDALAHYSPIAGGIGTSEQLGRFFTGQEPPPTGWATGENLARYAVAHELTHFQFDRLSPKDRTRAVDTFFATVELSQATMDFAMTLIGGDYYKGQEVAEELRRLDPSRFVSVKYARNGGPVIDHWYSKELIVNELLGHAAFMTQAPIGHEMATSEQMVKGMVTTAQMHNMEALRQNRPITKGVDTLRAMGKALHCLTLLQEKPTGSPYRNAFQFLQERHLVPGPETSSDVSRVLQEVRGMHTAR